ncbi:MAG: hypothetical protein EOP90_06780 [Lysobacteraceae bacterium]|nr:MAG: hypothetical protein EOP90_06780 [Xanthomonadaceae bacterium]
MSAASASRLVSAWERYGLATIVASSCLMRAFLNRNYDASLVVRDEGGYLSNAAAFAGFAFDGASSYHAGYSLLIAPAFLLFDKPTSIYHGVQAVNLLLAAISILLVHRLIAELFPDERAARRLLALAVAAAYPAWMVLSSLAMSENAMVPSFCAATWLCLQVGRRGGRYWIGWGIACGWLYFIHPTAIASIGVAFAIAILFAVRRREWGWFFAFLLVCASLIVVYASWVQPWLISRLSVGSYPPNLHYPSWQAALQPLLSAGGLINLAQRLAGHTFYLLAGSLWLVWFASSQLLRDLVASTRARGLEPEIGAAAFAILGLLGTLALSALTFAAQDAQRLDHWMYGRYLEGAMMPALAMGYLAMPSRLDRTALAGLLLGAACAVVLAGAEPGTVINMLNVTALWQASVLQDRQVPEWWLAAGVVASMILLVRNDLARSAMFVIVFLACTGLVYARFLLPCHEIYAERFALAEHIRTQIAHSPTCVGLDVDSAGPSENSIEMWAKYGAHLFGNGLRRTTVEEWRTSCDGPLISWSRDLDRRVAGLTAVASEKHDAMSTRPGPFLWLRDAARSPSWLTVGDKVVASADNQQLGLMLGEGWYAPEPAGVWSAGDAELWLPIDAACRKACRVAMLVQPLRASAAQPLVLEVRVEERVVAHWRIDAEREQWHSFELPPTIDTARDTRIRLSTRQATTPAALGISADSRVLGVKLHELQLRAASDS